MILQAFSDVLQDRYERSERSAEVILHCWLMDILTQPEPKTQVDHVLHTELALEHLEDTPMIAPRSETGKTLLNSLYAYCRSYDQWQFRRWLHHSKASQFNGTSLP